MPCSRSCPKRWVARPRQALPIVWSRVAHNRAVALGLVLALSLGLAGCSGGTSSPTPKATSTVAGALSSLVPTYPAKLTEASAKKGTVAAADAIQALIAPTDVATVDNDAKFVPATKTNGAYYGVARGVATVSGFDPLAQAEAMEKLLVAAGWKSRDSKATTTKYAAVLTVDTAAGDAVLGLQAIAKGTKNPATVLISIESPDFEGD